MGNTRFQPNVPTPGLVSDDRYKASFQRAMSWDKSVRVVTIDPKKHDLAAAVNQGEIDTKYILLPGVHGSGANWTLSKRCFIQGTPGASIKTGILTLGVDGIQLSQVDVATIVYSEKDRIRLSQVRWLPSHTAGYCASLRGDQCIVENCWSEATTPGAVGVQLTLGKNCVVYGTDFSAHATPIAYLAADGHKLVCNLGMATDQVNADLLDGNHASAFAAASHGHPATAITVDTSGFSGNLSATDTDVQKALDTIDAMSTGGGSAVVVTKDGTADYSVGAGTDTCIIWTNMTARRLLTLPSPTAGKMLSVQTPSATATYPLRVASTSGNVGEYPEIALNEKGCYRFEGDGTNWAIVSGPVGWVPSGRILNPTDYPLTSPNAMDDEFLGRDVSALNESFGGRVPGAASSKWTAAAPIGFATYTAAVTKGRFTLVRPASGTDALCAFLQACPAGDVEFACCVAIDQQLRSWVAGGLIICEDDDPDAVSNKAATAVISANADTFWLQLVRFNTFTNWNSTPYAEDHQNFTPQTYLRAKRVGTTWSFAVSWLGQTWFTFYSITEATLGFAPGFVGLVANNTAVVGTDEMQATFKWFRRTA